MRKTIDIRDLEILLENSEDFQADAKKYFEPRYTDDGGVLFQLKPGVTLDAPVTVLDGRYNTYAFGKIGGWIADWVIELERKNRRKKYLKKKDKPGITRIVAEGDSWFEHPLVSDIIDWIEDRDEYAVMALARAGDELRQMVNPGEYLKAVEKEKPKFFLLSAGGNDFLGDITPHLQLPANKNSTNPADYLSPEFPKLLAQMRLWLDEVFTAVLGVAEPPKRIVMHGYDYVIPCTPNDDRSGKWLGVPMRRMGIVKPALQASIVKEMIDQYTGVLTSLAADRRWNDSVHFVDFRGTLTKTSQWYDEIHPKDKQNKKLAKVILELLTAL